MESPDHCWGQNKLLKHGFQSVKPIQFHFLEWMMHSIDQPQPANLPAPPKVPGI